VNSSFAGRIGNTFLNEQITGKESGMKKACLLVVALFLMGCGAAAERSEFYKHDSHFKSWSHMGFSVQGYKNPTAADADKSDAQGWWGEPIEVPFGTK